MSSKIRGSKKSSKIQGSKKSSEIHGNKKSSEIHGNKKSSEIHGNKKSSEIQGNKETSKIPTKTCLKNTPMYVYRLQGGKEQEFKIVLWRIPDFKESGSYFQGKHEDWTMTACKKDNLTVTVTNKDYDKIKECFVPLNYDENILSSAFSGETNKIGNKYSVRIPLENVTVGNKLIDNEGECHLMIKVVTKSENPLPIRPFLRDRTFYRKSLEFCSFLKRLRHQPKYEDDVIGESICYIWDSRSFTDFAVTVERNQIRVHKAILVSRSEYFKKCIGKRESKSQTTTSEIKFNNTTYEVMEIALKFLYTGKIKVEKMEKMLAVFELAKTLKLKGLQRLCLWHISNAIDDGNVDQIFKTAKKCDEEPLLSEAKSFIWKNKSKVKGSSAKSKRKK